MSNKKLDKDTQKVFAEGQEIVDMVKSPGWGQAKHFLIESALSIGNIMTIKGDDPSKVMIQLAARQMAVETLFNWIRDIEGTAAQHLSNSEEFLKLQREEYVMRFEEKT